MQLTSHERPLIVVYGYLSIDSITVCGQRHDGVPGGGALHAALGAQAAGAQAAIVAMIGEDYPEAWLDGLAERGIVAACIERCQGPTRRARLAHDESGLRQSAHFAEAAWWDSTAALAPRPLPAPQLEPDLAVIAPMPLAAARAIAERHRGRAVLDVSEAFAAQDPAGWRMLAPLLRLFAPSREETRLLCPGLDDDRALLALARDGCDVVQKRGAAGLALAAAGGDGVVAIPAEAAAVVDPTGAGDATVGAIAARLAAGDGLRDACRAAMAVGARAVSGIGAAGLGYAPRFTQPHLSA